jgi:hypothetical protein
MIRKSFLLITQAAIFMALVFGLSGCASTSKIKSSAAITTAPAIAAIPEGYVDLSAVPSDQLYSMLAAEWINSAKNKYDTSTRGIMIYPDIYKKYRLLIGSGFSELAAKTEIYKDVVNRISATPHLPKKWVITNKAWSGVIPSEFVYYAPTTNELSLINNIFSGSISGDISSKTNDYCRKDAIFEGRFCNKNQITNIGMVVPVNKDISARLTPEELYNLKKTIAI